MRCGIALASAVMFELTGSSRSVLTAAMRSGSTSPSIVSSVLIESVMIRFGGSGKATSLPSMSVTVYAAGFSSAAFGVPQAVRTAQSTQRRSNIILF